MLSRAMLCFAALSLLSCAPLCFGLPPASLRLDAIGLEEGEATDGPPPRGADIANSPLCCVFAALRYAHQPGLAGPRSAMLRPGLPARINTPLLMC